MGECAFCEVAAGRENERVIYEDNKVIAFLDHKPIVLGHVLVIPREHCKCIEDISDADLMAVMNAIRRIGPMVMEVVDADGYLVSINNHDQQVYHAHWHIIPRSEGDGLSDWKRKFIDKKELEEFARKMRELL